MQSTSVVVLELLALFLQGAGVAAVIRYRLLTSTSYLYFIPLHEVPLLINDCGVARCTMLRGILPNLRGNLRLEYVVGMIGKRGIASSTSVLAKKMPDKPPPVGEDEFTESFLKGSGPGGQKIVSRLRLRWLFFSALLQREKLANYQITE